MNTRGMTRNLTLRIDNEEVSVTARRDGDTIIVERDGVEYRAHLVSDQVVGRTGPPVGAGAQKAADSPKQQTQPERKAPAPAPVAAGPAAAGPGAIVAPMIGVVKEVLVSPGDSVSAGQQVVVLEAMKMDIDVVSHGAGVVSQVSVTAGDNVTEGQQLVRVTEGGA